MRALDAQVGEWEAELVVTPPGAPGNRSRARASRRLVAGRWLVTDYRTEQGFEGHGVLGYGPDGRLAGTWVDAMSPAIARSTGTFDEATGTLTLEVEANGRRYREVTVFRPDGTHEYQNLLPMPDGSEHLLIRSVYRRTG